MPIDLPTAMQQLRIRAATATDLGHIEALLHEAFGGPGEAELVSNLRDGGYSLLELVAELKDVSADDATPVIGHVLFSRLHIETPHSVIPAASLAPLAVGTIHRRLGISAQLVRAGLTELRAHGERIVFVLGEPAYYSRFGFSAAAAAGFECVYACDAFQSLDLDRAATPITSGRVAYAPPFALL